MRYKNLILISGISISWKIWLARGVQKFKEFESSANASHCTILKIMEIGNFKNSG